MLSLMYSFSWPVSCKSSIDSFVKSFLTFKTCFETFLLQNVTMVVHLLPTRWQSSMSLSETSTPAFVITLQTKSSWSLSLTDAEMPENSRHFLLEYWAFAQHCFFIVWGLSNDSVHFFFATFRSDFIWSNLFQQRSHCLLNPICFVSWQLVLLSQVYWAFSVTLQLVQSQL